MQHTVQTPFMTSIISSEKRGFEPQARLALTAFVKTVSLGFGLDPLPFQRGLCFNPAQRKVAADDLLTPFVETYQAGRNMIERAEPLPESYEDVKALFDAKDAFLQSLPDKTFLKLEVPMLDAWAKSGALEHIRAATLALLPTDALRASAQNCATSLLALRREGFTKYVSAATQTPCITVLGAVKSLAKLECPPEDDPIWANNAFELEARDRMSKFVRVEQPGMVPLFIYGSDAVLSKMAELTEKCDQDAQVGLEDLREMMCFKWTLNDGDKDNLTRLAVRVEKLVSDAEAAASAAAAGAAAVAAAPPALVPGVAASSSAGSVPPPAIVIPPVAKKGRKASNAGKKGKKAKVDDDDVNHEAMDAAVAALFS